MSTNISILTQSHNAIAAKKRQRSSQIKEIIFDDDARREFLTGFHKRKVAKQEAAKKKALERQKQERLEARREKRRALREQAARNAVQVEKAYGAIIDSDEEWSGIDKGKQREDEYDGKEELATVTVVEDFDPDEIIHGPKAVPDKPASITEPPPLPSKLSKVKPQKIKYETSRARKAARSKQQARRTEKAELAGGKASKKRKGKR